MERILDRLLRSNDQEEEEAIPGTSRSLAEQASAQVHFHFIIFCTFAMKDVPPEFGFGNELFSAKSEPFWHYDGQSIVEIRTCALKSAKMPRMRKQFVKLQHWRRKWGSQSQPQRRNAVGQLERPFLQLHQISWHLRSWILNLLVMQWVMPWVMSHGHSLLFITIPRFVTKKKIFLNLHLLSSQWRRVHERVPFSYHGYKLLVAILILRYPITWRLVILNNILSAWYMIL